MKQTLRLETPHLLLRPFQPQEFESFSNFMQNKEATRFLLLSPEHKTPEGIQKLFEEIQKSYYSYHETLVLAIADKASNQLIGITGLCEDFNSEHPQLFWHMLEAGGKHEQTAEAVRKLIQYAVQELNINKLTAYIAPEDSPNIQIAKDAELKEEGTLHSKATGSTALLFKI
jgi:[ribosomal protein S5]-alanine N-acetyltransferase